MCAGINTLNTQSRSSGVRCLRLLEQRVGGKLHSVVFAAALHNQKCMFSGVIINSARTSNGATARTNCARAKSNGVRSKEAAPKLTIHEGYPLLDPLEGIPQTIVLFGCTLEKLGPTHTFALGRFTVARSTLWRSTYLLTLPMVRKRSEERCCFIVFGT